MNDNGIYRFIGNKGFYQSKDNNMLNGGTLRKFETIEASIINNTFLDLLIKKNLSKIDSYAEWLVHIHQIRIICTENEAGNPTPEGIHRDGHQYVAQILIAKNGVCGGVSRIYDNNKALIFSKKLESPLDTILVNDKKSYHDVTQL